MELASGPVAAPCRVADPRSWRPAVRWSAAAALVWVAVVATAESLGPDGPANRWHSISSLVGNAVAAYCCLRTGLRHRGARRGWRLLVGASALCLTANAAVALWSPAAHLPGTTTPLAMVLPVGVAVFLVPGVLVFPTEAHVGAPGGRSATVLLDGLVVVGSLVQISWDFLVEPVLAASRAVADGTLYLAGYCELILVMALVLVIGIFREPLERRAWTLLGAGLATMFGTGVVLGYLQATGHRYTPAAAALGFAIGPLLIAFAVSTTGSVPRRRSARAGRFAVGAHAFLPYPFAVGVGVTLAVHALKGRGPTAFDLILGTALLVLIGARQLLTIVDNTRLLLRVQAGQQALQQQAFHDSLTGLANRALFRDRLEHALTLHRRELRPLALLFLDLDGFKEVNDRLGHAGGDELLREVAGRLRAATRESDTVARLGGDEFGILLEGDRDPVALGERLVEALHVPYVLDGVACAAGASVGLVVVSLADRHLLPEALLRQADVAMYAAKARGKGTMVRYRPDLTVDDGGLDLRTGLALALTGDPAGGTLGVDYQPIATLADGRTRAVEALARWIHPDRGPVSPTLFVAAAEQSGLIGALDTFVLHRACADIARIEAAGGTPPQVHVNVSATRVGDDSFPGTVEGALRRYGLRPSALVVEITETGQIPDLAGAAVALGRLADQGVRIALDDIGAGRTSVAALHLLPVHIIKLDRSLLASDADRRGVVLRTGLVTLAHSLGMVVVAEGIETVDQRDTALAAGCDLGQGFWLGMPGPLVATSPERSAGRPAGRGMRA